MSDRPSVSPLSALLARTRTGDPNARNELFRAAQGRLEDIARRMLHKSQAVRRWVETGDMVQNATIRLLRAMESSPVADTRGFFGLAATVMRRELIDLARHFNGPHGIGANHATPDANGDSLAGGQTVDHDPGELELWTRLHEAVARMPAENGEVFGLTFYHGWSQAQIAEEFGIDERTVRRRWRRAVEALSEELGERFPDV
jgi:RNA polymerase sigma factor (sigma-70 family)